MENLGIEDFRAILQIAEIAHSASDWDALGQDVLAAVVDSAGAEKAVFMLQEVGGAPLRFFYWGIDRADADRYLACYYSHDPLCLLSRMSDHLEVSRRAIGSPTVSLMERVSRDDFMRTRYYTEFYRPQGVLYEIATRLESSSGVKGVFDLLRSERAPAFSVREIQLMNCLAPHLSRALDAVEVRELKRSTPDFRATLKDRFGLTCREADIVRKMFEGKSNAQIATELFITEFTVKKHVQHICDKMNVRSRTAILSRIYRTLGSSFSRSSAESLLRGTLLMDAPEAADGGALHPAAVIS